MSCCEVCTHGIMSDTTSCCLKTRNSCRGVPICMSDSLYFCLGKIKSCIGNCAACTPRVVTFWFLIDTILLAFGGFLVLVGWIFPEPTLYIGIGLFTAGVIPWIIYGLYLLYLEFS